jgi:hypothetical protein
LAGESDSEAVEDFGDLAAGKSEESESSLRSPREARRDVAGALGVEESSEYSVSLPE